MKLLDPETVIAINRLTIKLHGGMFIPPDNLRPAQGLGFIDQVRANRVFGAVLYPSPHHQAAAYLYYVCKNHTFNDGNKRTGLACALTILEWNKLPCHKIENEEGETFVLSVATSKRDPGEEIDRIATWFRPEGPKSGGKTRKKSRRSGR